MDSLLIGNSSVLSKKSIQEIFISEKKDMCLVCSEDFSESRSGRVRYLHTPQGQYGYDFLFENNHFDNVIYFSEFLTPDRTPFHEMERLGAALASVSSHIGRTSRFLYVVPSIRLQEKEGRDFVALCRSASLSLFSRYRRELAGKVAFAVIRTPYITGSLESGDFLTRIFGEAEKKQELSLPWPSNAQIPLLYEEDLRDFFVRFMDLWDGTPADLVLNPCRQEDRTKTSVAFFAESLREETGCEVKTEPEADMESLIYLPEEKNIAGKIYGWHAETDVSGKLHELLDQYESLHPGSKKHFLSSLNIPRGILTLLELAAGTVITQLLVNLSGSIVQFRVIDFRLLFVVITATMYGSGVGFIAALIMCGSLFFAYEQNGFSADMLLYNPSNWIPFILFFGVSAVCGYTRQNLRDRISVLEKDRDDLSRENMALNGLYVDAARTRDNYREDLMMSRNSFGEIFEVVQKLNHLHPDAIYSDAVPIFEEILDTKSVALYDISDQSAVFARLEVCSSEKKEVYPRSIRLTDHPGIAEALRKGDLWVNRQARAHLPSYIAGVTDEDGHLAVAILIDGIPFERMTSYYANIVRVLVGIMQSFLLRAFHYSKQQKERYYYPGTILLHEDVFAAKFRQVKKEASDGITSWRLLEIDGKGKNVDEWDRLLVGKIRTTDTVCYADDGNVYLLLNQVDETTESIVLRRYMGYGFSCRYAEDLPETGKEQNA